MIYKILGKDVCDALVEGSRFITFSFDGEFALIISDVEISNWLSKHADSELDTLRNAPLYKQPCKDC